MQYKLQIILTFVLAVQAQLFAIGSERSDKGSIDKSRMKELSASMRFVGETVDFIEGRTIKQVSVHMLLQAYPSLC